MPLYEYQCKKCGHRFERLQKRHSDPPPAKCPECGGKVEQLVSAPAVQFKGSGWYATDYAKKPAGGDGSGAASKGGEKKGAKAADKATPSSSSSESSSSSKDKK